MVTLGKRFGAGTRGKVSQGQNLTSMLVQSAVGQYVDMRLFFDEQFGVYLRHWVIGSKFLCLRPTLSAIKKIEKLSSLETWVELAVELQALQIQQFNHSNSLPNGLTP